MPSQGGCPQGTTCGGRMRTALCRAASSCLLACGQTAHMCWVTTSPVPGAMPNNGSILRRVCAFWLGTQQMQEHQEPKPQHANPFSRAACMVASNVRSTAPRLCLKQAALSCMALQPAAHRGQEHCRSCFESSVTYSAHLRFAQTLLLIERPPLGATAPPDHPIDACMRSHALDSYFCMSHPEPWPGCCSARASAWPAGKSQHLHSVLWQWAAGSRRQDSWV
jgi:hypothetical protein